MTPPTDPLETLGRRSALAVAERRGVLDPEAEVAAVARRAGRPRRRQIAVMAVAVLAAVPLTVSLLRPAPRDVQFTPAPAPEAWVEVGRDVFNGTEPPSQTRPMEGTFAGGVSGVAIAGETIVAVGLEPDPGPGSVTRPSAWTSQDGRTWDQGGVDDGGSTYAEAGLLMEDVVPVVTGDTEWLVAVGYANFEPRTEPIMWESYDGGATWGLVPVGGTGVMTSVVATSNGLVAVGYDNDLPAAWIAATGEEWVRTQVGGAGGTFPGTLTDVAASGGRLVASGADRAGSQQLWVSEGGHAWEPATLPAVPVDTQVQLSSVSAAPSGGFLAAGSLATAGEETRDGIVLESDDGRSWERMETLGTIGGDGGQYLSAVAPAPEGLLAVGSDDRQATIWSSAGGAWEVVFTDDTVPDGGLSSAEELFPTPAGLLVTGIATAEQGPQEARAWLRAAPDGEQVPPPAEIINQPMGTFGGAKPLGPVTADGVTVTAEEQSGVITAVDEESGAPLWTYDLYENAYLGPVVDETLLAASQYGQVVALDMTSGSERWTLDRHLDVVESPGAPTVEGGVVYIPTSYPIEGGTAAPRVRAVDLATGAVLWTRSLEAGTDLQWAPPVVTEDLVLVADTLSHPRSAPTSWLHALDRRTGERVWRFDLETRRQGFDERPPLVDAGRVFVAGPFGPLFAIDLATGEQLWRRPDDEEPRVIDLQGANLRVEINGRERLVDVDSGELVG